MPGLLPLLKLIVPWFVVSLILPGLLSLIMPGVLPLLKFIVLWFVVSLIKLGLLPLL